MLKILRDNATSFIVKILLGIIVLVFVFLGVGSRNSGQKNIVAKVNGEEVSIDDYKASYNMLLAEYRQYFRNNLTDELIKSFNLKGQALDRLIDRVVVRQQAENMKLRVSDSELSAEIRKVSAFQKDGAFDIDQYKRALAFNRETPESFESSMRSELLVRKIQQAITEDVKVSDLEAREWFNWENASMDAAFLKFDPASYKDIDPKDEEVKVYFGENGDKYKTEARMKVKYVTFDPEAYKSDVKVSGDDISSYYEDRLDDFTHEKKVEASHILIKVKEGEEKKALAEAENVYKLAASGKDFADLAAKYSEGPTKDRGGFLGSFKKSDMVKPFADAAFAMKAGDVSKPVKTQFGYHVLKVSKVEEARTETLDEASARIKVILEQERFSSAAYDQAVDVYDTILDGQKLEDATGIANVKLGETDLFTRGEAVKGFTDGRKLSQVAFELSGNEISDVQEIGGKYYLIQPSERIESRVDDYENVKYKARLDLIAKLQDEKARESAASALKSLKDGKSMDEVGKEFGVKADSTGLFQKTDTMDKLENNAAVKNAVFTLSSEKKIIDEPVKGYNGYFALMLKDRALPADKEFSDKKNNVIQTIEARKKSETFRDWVTQTRESSEIEIDQELVGMF